MGKQKFLNDRREEDAVDNRYLTFWMDKQLFGLAAVDVVQIVGLQQVTKIPDFPAHIKGVIHLRGDIFPVMDMRIRFGRPKTDYNDRTCIIVTKIFESLFGLIVDEVDQVCNLPAQRIIAAPHVNTGSVNTCLSGIGKLEADDGREEKVILLLNIKTLLSEEKVLE